MPPGPHDSHNSGYGHEPWMTTGSYSQPEPQTSYQAHADYNSYGYISTQPVPMEPSFTMSRPPPYASALGHGQMPPPLIMPQTPWPSEILASTTNTYQTPILPAPNFHTPILQTPVSATSLSSDRTPTSARSSNSRRKLTDDERRLMCLEAENNPTMKQTQIGAKFNVERSTVSKILRQRDKYINSPAKEEITSPDRKFKVKQPDIEKTLANWARKQLKGRQNVTNEELRKQVMMFSAGRSDQDKYLSTAWLEKFRKQYLSSSQAGSPREGTGETAQSQTLVNSPSSSEDGVISSTDISNTDPVRSPHQLNQGHDMFDFDTRDFDQSSMRSQNFAVGLGVSSVSVMSSLESEFKDPITTMIDDKTPTNADFPRQRSMTLPHLAPAIKPQRDVNLAEDIRPVPARAATTVNEIRSISVDPRQTMKRHKSNPDMTDPDAVRYSSMHPPALPRAVETPSISSSLPFQDDPLRSLRRIKELLESNPEVAEPDDYVMIGKLMEKVRLLRSPSSTPGLTTDSPRLSRKRAITEMSP